MSAVKGSLQCLFMLNSHYFLIINFIGWMDHSKRKHFEVSRQKLMVCDGPLVYLWQSFYWQL
jgi:hypothetical protein